MAGRSAPSETDLLAVPARSRASRGQLAYNCCETCGNSYARQRQPLTGLRRRPTQNGSLRQNNLRTRQSAVGPRTAATKHFLNGGADGADGHMGVDFCRSASGWAELASGYSTGPRDVSDAQANIPWFKGRALNCRGRFHRHGVLPVMQPQFAVWAKHSR